MVFESQVIFSFLFRWKDEIGDGFQFLLTEGDRKRLANKALTIFSKETASRETVMAQIGEILTEKKKSH